MSTKNTLVVVESDGVLIHVYFDWTDNSYHLEIGGNDFTFCSSNVSGVADFMLSMDSAEELASCLKKLKKQTEVTKK